MRERVLLRHYVQNGSASFSADASTRRSDMRQRLREQTGWSDDLIESWATKLDRNPKKDRLLAAASQSEWTTDLPPETTTQRRRHPPAALARTAVVAVASSAVAVEAAVDVVAAHRITQVVAEVGPPQTRTQPADEAPATLAPTDPQSRRRRRATKPVRGGMTRRWLVSIPNSPRSELDHHILEFVRTHSFVRTGDSTLRLFSKGIHSNCSRSRLSRYLWKTIQFDKLLAVAGSLA